MSPQQTFALRARVEALRDLSPSVREITLRPEGTGHDRAWTLGSHLRVAVELADGRADDRRYSLVGAPAAGAPWRIAVKRVAASRGGSAFMWRLREGDVVPVQAPANHFELPPGVRPTLLVAGGIGITPLLGMALALATRRGADLRMAYAAHQAADLVYADELQRALGERLATYAGERGERIDIDTLLRALPSEGQCIACGPATLLEALREAWSAAGRPAQRLRFETFGTSGHEAAEAFWVELPRHSLRFEVPADRSLLDMLESHGVACLADCLRGECGLCNVDILEVRGRVDHRDVFMAPAEQRENRRLCACVSRVTGGGIVIDSAWRPDMALADPSILV